MNSSHIYIYIFALLEIANFMMLCNDQYNSTRKYRDTVGKYSIYTEWRLNSLIGCKSIVIYVFK